MPGEQEAERAIALYADTVKRLCMLHLKNRADTEDIFQNVFLKYLLRKEPFESPEHERAWLIRVTINACKDTLRDFFRSRSVPLSEITELAGEVPPEHSEVLEAVLSLAAKYRDAVYLFYYEQYSALEIAQILGKNRNTVYTLLARAREMLRTKLGGDCNG